MLPLSPAERGSKGGQATFQRHGTPHMSVIGYSGRLIVVTRYFGGDVAATMQYVRNAKLNPDQEKTTAYFSAA